MSSEIKVDTISEKTSANGVTIDGVNLKDSVVKTDTISEKTSAAGVTIDSVLLKDGISHSGLVKLTSSTASGTSVITFDNFVDTSTYAYYKLVCTNIVPADSGGKTLRVTFRQGGGSGSDLNGTYYGMQWASYGNTAVSGFDSNFSQTNVGDVSDTLDNGAGNALNSIINFFPSNGTNSGTSYWTQYVTKDNSPYYVARMRARYLDSTTACTGIKFFMDAGNIASGTVTVFGVKS